MFIFTIFLIRSIRKGYYRQKSSASKFKSQSSSSTSAKPHTEQNASPCVPDSTNEPPDVSKSATAGAPEPAYYENGAL